MPAAATVCLLVRQTQHGLKAVIATAATATESGGGGGPYLVSVNLLCVFLISAPRIFGAQRCAGSGNRRLKSPVKAKRIHFCE